MGSSFTDTTSRSYIHGYSSDEQARLVEQARFLESMIFQGVDFSGCNNVLEIGCGVGAMSKLLLKRFPNIKLISIDISEAQLQAARQNCAAEVAQGRVEFLSMNAAALTFKDKAFDGVFVCWVLEHVSEPFGILRELKRCLKPGGMAAFMEVQNSTLFLNPPAPNTMSYWDAMCRKQAETGDPNVGAKLGVYLTEAGFKNIRLRFPMLLHDQRNSAALKAMMDYWTSLLLSGADVLQSDGRVSADVVDKMKRELQVVEQSPHGVFLYTPVGALASG